MAMKNKKAVVLSSFFSSADYNLAKFLICHGYQITPFDALIDCKQP